MNNFSSMKAILPKTIKSWLKRKLYSCLREINKPRMIWGYLDSSGKWCARTRISSTVFFYHPERIKISDNVFIWHYTILDGVGGLEINEGSQIGAGVGIFTHSSHMAIRLYGRHYHEVSENEKVAYPIKPVRIGKFTFIGAGATILPGVTIGDGVIIAAGSMVAKDIPDFKIASGSSAEIVGDTRKVDAKYLEKDPQLKKWYEEWRNN